MIYAIGSFDGFHAGHRELLKKACELAQNSDNWGVITFDRNPQQLFIRDNFKQIFTDAERDFYAECLGIPKLVKIRFTKEFSRLSPEQFMSLLKNKYKAEGLVVGCNFRFGADRGGDTAFVKKFCSDNNMLFSVVDMVLSDDRPVSSTRIRSLISAGNVAETAEVLGIPYFISGIVREGRHTGRELGYPTANILPDDGKLYPPDGSYATLTLAGERLYPSVTNLGRNPTFNGKKTVCETYIIDFSGNSLYGLEIKVFFISRIREEKKFGSAEQLADQIAADVACARMYAAEYIKNNASAVALITA